MCCVLAFVGHCLRSVVCLLLFVRSSLLLLCCRCLILFVIACSCLLLFVLVCTCCSLFAVCLLFDVNCCLLIGGCLLFVVARCSLFLFVVWCLVRGCMFCAVHCLWFVICCIALFVVSWRLLTVSCFSLLGSYVLYDVSRLLCPVSCVFVHCSWSLVPSLSFLDCVSCFLFIVFLLDYCFLFIVSSLLLLVPRVSSLCFVRLSCAVCWSAARCLLFVVGCCLLFAVCCLLCRVACFLPCVDLLLLVCVWCLLCVSCCLLMGVRCVLSVVCYLARVVGWSLCGVCCLLCVDY